MTDKLLVTHLPVEGRRVLVRVDYNVPLRDGRVFDDRRIRASLETVEHLLSRGARPILVSHLGRPKGKTVPELSLLPVAEALRGLVDAPVRFVEHCVGPEAEAAARAGRPGDLLLLENLRFHAEEESNDEGFARALASLAELYVNDAFGTAHRAHASTAGVCRHVKSSAAGFLMDRELRALSRLLEETESPYVAVLGGAKVSDKIPLARNLLPRVDAMLIGGAMAYTFLKAKGVPVGGSRVEEKQVADAGALIDEAGRGGVDVQLPVDHVVLPVGRDDTSDASRTEGPQIETGFRGVDVGPATIRRFGSVISSARTILWNGPLGLFEQQPFDTGTRRVAEAIAGSKAYSVIGGGDSAAAVASFGLESGFSHISTGGGASLEFLSGMALPGVVSLSERE